MLCYDESLPSLRKQCLVPRALSLSSTQNEFFRRGSAEDVLPLKKRSRLCFPAESLGPQEQGEPGRVRLGRQPATHSDGVPNLAPYSHWCRSAPREEDRKSGLLCSALWPQGRLGEASRRRKILPTLRETMLSVSAEEGGPRRRGLGRADAFPESSRLRATCLVWLPWPERFWGLEPRSLQSSC